ncbi:MAG: thiamine-phosphate kinase [Nitrospirae bacterium]|nr:thiamine-phosphate kinase [Nitrospirota bacterium]
MKRSHKTFLREIGEFGLIRKIRNAFPSKDPSVLLGIGDDTAVLRPASGKLLLLTVDTLREGVHFHSSYADPFSIGWKVVAVSLSDVAAMGGRPRFLLMSLSIPKTVSESYLDRLFLGMRSLLKRYSISLIGGNISRSVKGLSMDTTLIGEAVPGRLLTRSGASVGDLVYVTGTMGDSAAGLELLKRKRRLGDTRTARLMQRHLRPEPRIEEGKILAIRRLATSAIDISDGLLQDLSHLCGQSRVGSRIDVRSLPLSPALRRSAPLLRKKTFDYALSGGEDYELLFTVKPQNREKVESLRKSMGMRWTRIGEIVRRAEGVTLSDPSGQVQKVNLEGYDHFRT